MKFVQTHLTRHHLLHAPHKWFLAFLVSPVHFLELHYKKKYHLNFIHARKLFIFDMLLIASIFVIGASALTWYLYDPTVTDLVNVSISIEQDKDDATGEKIISGEHITIHANFINESDVELVEPVIDFIVPNGFVADSGQETRKHLDSLSPKKSGGAYLSGIFYGIPDEDTQITAVLSYRQAERDAREEKRATIHTALRGSALLDTVEVPEKIVNQSIFKAKIKLENIYKFDLANISMPLEFGDGFELMSAKSEDGEIKDNHWQIEKIKPREKFEIEMEVKANISESIKNIDFTATPVIALGNQTFVQQTASSPVQVLHPKLSIQAGWLEDLKSLPASGIGKMDIIIRNNGDIDLTDLILNIPIPKQIVDINKIASLNSGYVLHGSFVSNKKYLANLKELKPGTSIKIELSIPITYAPSGTGDLELILEPLIMASVPKVPDAKVEAKTKTSALAIGGRLNLNAELRYYTNEGDQLGRGPLPPKVGEQTKYWAMFTITNSASKIENVKLTAKLPNYIVWTGRSSVSHGSDVIFDPNSRTVSWGISSLAPNVQAGIYFELAFTPGVSQQGKSPILVQDVLISGYDTRLGLDLKGYSGDLDISLPADTIGRQKGVAVE